MSTFNLSSSKIPEHILKIVGAFQEILGERAYDFILIGASARDLIMDGIYELGLSRLTQDVDFALFVPEWDDYRTVRERLIGSGRFSATRITHKLLFENAYEIDIVPFGNIQNEQGQYTWPPDHIKAMNVAGFVEINEGGIQISSGGLQFKVASVPGICVMKLLAWKDRGRQDDRDGKDLGFILANYIELKYEDLYELHEDLMTTDDFDRITTIARIMGRDIYALLKANATAVEQIKQILIAEMADEEYSRLALTIKAGGVSSYAQAYRCLSAILNGISDKGNSN